MPALSALSPDLPKALQLAGGVTVRPAAKIALKLADKLQDGLIAEGWPEGKNLGPEAEIARHHRTTERVIREAVRVLEWRGVGAVRRGHAGGLVVGSPSTEDAGRFLGLYLAAINCSSADVARNGNMLLREFPDEQSKPREFLRLLIDRTLESKPLTSKNTLGPGRPSTSNRALRISYRILDDLNETSVLLTIDDMMDRYDVGRPVLVQALRALESVELIKIVRGRSGGVARCRPTAGAMVRTVLPAFLASGLQPEEFGFILAAANIRCAVAACRSAARMTTLRKLSAELDEKAFEHGDMAAQIKILRQIASYSGDELSHLFARSVWYYLARQNTGRCTCDPASARLMVNVTRALVDAVLSGNPEAAAETCRELHRHLGEVAVRSVGAQRCRPFRLAGRASGQRAASVAV